jgi:hypothetical protein
MGMVATTHNAGRQVGDDLFLEVRDESRCVGLAHLHETSDHRLAGFEERGQKLRRNLIVVTFIRGNIDDDVAQRCRFQ